MRIAHESPLSIFNEVQKVTDYDYFLVHLFETHPAYWDLARKAVFKGRETILDNSIFELGKAFDGHQYAKWVEKLEPSYYILPDSLENMKETVEQYENFDKNFSRLPGKQIGVVQGKTYAEIKECYQRIYDLGADKIAISFDYSYYKNQFPHLNKLEAWMKGRIQLIDQLLQDHVIKHNTPHHLLGVSLPQEFEAYKGDDYKFIESMDSSNPVVHGLFNKRYDGTQGLQDKMSIKLCDLIDADPTPTQLHDIFYNIEQFKLICNI